MQMQLMHCVTLPTADPFWWFLLALVLQRLSEQVASLQAGATKVAQVLETCKEAALKVGAHLTAGCYTSVVRLFLCTFCSA